MTDPLEVLPFLSAWRHVLTTRTLFVQSTEKSEEIPQLGWISAILAVVTDSTTTFNFRIDDFEYSVSPSSLQTRGETQANNQYFYNAAYAPSEGTAGTFVIAFNPARPVPVRKSFAYGFSLGANSTQTSELVGLAVDITSIDNEQQFLASLQKFNTLTAPNPAAVTRAVPTRAPIAIKGIISEEAELEGLR